MLTEKDLKTCPQGGPRLLNNFTAQLLPHPARKVLLVMPWRCAIMISSESDSAPFLHLPSVTGLCQQEKLPGGAHN